MMEKYQELKKSIMEDVMEQKSISSESFLYYIINEYLVDSKRIDHEDVTIGYFDQNIEHNHCKMNGYMFNTTQERLQIFIIDENSYAYEELNLVSKAEDYSLLFKPSTNFIKKVFLRHFFDGDNPLIQNVPNLLTKAFINTLSIAENVRNIDTVEIFLITLDLTVRRDSNGNIRLREDMEVTPPGPIKFRINLPNEKITKEIKLKYSLVDLNFLYRINTSINGREPIKITLEDNEALDYIQVANENDFKSYLTALPGNFLYKIYSEYSSRLLERNIRAFLDFKNTKDNVNSGMKRTIIDEPHKFVAFNNGLTITCNNVDIKNINGVPKIVGFDDFQIVNGGQTTASIYFTATQKYDITNVKVMAKVNMIGSHNEEFDSFVADISNYSNAQNKVNKVDLKSNEPVLQKIKILSNTVTTPLGKKWFYEKSRGELGAVKRKNNWSPSQLNTNFPKSRRFQNTELAKYYISWDKIPYKIKKGGESVFVEFIDKIKSIGVNEINRYFFENLIARVILFRSLEKIHGAGKGAIGQLRAAVIPYSISILYNYSQNKSNSEQKYTLDFESIWKNERISDEMHELFYELMKSMYLWIDKYKTSTDISENTKKEELWNKISKSDESKDFLMKNQEILNKIIVKEIKNNNTFFDFSGLQENIKFHAKGFNYYKELKKTFIKHLSYQEQDIFDTILSNYIIALDSLPQILQASKLDKNIQDTLASKKTKIAKEKLIQIEKDKKPTLTLKERHLKFLEEIELKLCSIDQNLYESLSSVNNNNELIKILDDVELAFNNNDFNKLMSKAIINQKKGIGLKYQIEYLSCLQDFRIPPSIIDLYQLLPLYKI